MERILWNQDWYLTEGMVYSFAYASKYSRIDLPYDIMIREKRSKDTKNGIQSGFYPGGVYTYMKRFYVPTEWRNEQIQVVFEGVQGNARVFINGNYAAGNQNGYSAFTVDANEFLTYGEENELDVLVDSLEQSSRWYPGSGIYRDVWLLKGGKVNIPKEGVRISTPEAESDVAVALVEVPVENVDIVPKSCWLRISVFDQKEYCVSKEHVKVTVYPGKCQVIRQRMTIEEPELWNVDTPVLYSCRAELLEDGRMIDQDTAAFGIRKLQLDRKYGLRINGESVKLRGVCIHHDHGIVGASVFRASEERKIRLLKEAGFNCIRSAHNPCSRTMLEVCDSLGMLVMDELSDVWTIPKNIHDYAQCFPNEWRQSVKAMVEKDFNHPSVIMYSMGNELPEAGRARGGYWNREVNAYFKELDASRYTTNAANGTMATMYTSLADMVDKVRKELAMEDIQEIEAGDVKDTAGAAFLNMMMAAQSGPVADQVVCLPEMDEALTEFESAMDIAGYNYMTTLHKPDGKRYPNRLLLATETYPAEVARVWQNVKDNIHVLGEMTWTGYDYIGEAGFGIFYYDGRSNFTSTYPSTLAYIGDIDLTGFRRPVSYYREIVYGLRKLPYIAIQKPQYYGREYSPSPWLFSDTLESWTWRGYEGRPVVVEVYSRDQEVELYLDNELLERRTVGEEMPCLVRFHTEYTSGTLTAVAYRNGKETGRVSLITARENVCIRACLDQKKAVTDDLAYVVIELTDNEGIPQRTEERKLTVTVEGAGILEGIGSADPKTTEQYQSNVWNTYEGRLLLAVRTDSEPGDITVTVSGEDCGVSTVTFPVYLSSEKE